LPFVKSEWLFNKKVKGKPGASRRRKAKGSILDSQLPNLHGLAFLLEKGERMREGITKMGYQAETYKGSEYAYHPFFCIVHKHYRADHIQP
jgi:hypothetical protein